MLTIRSFQPADREAIIALWHQCDLIRPQNDPLKDIARKEKAGSELFLVGLEGDEIVASVMAGYEGHRGWINYLAVAPDHQRKGHGRALMKAAEERLRSLGCPKINLQVRATNQEVLAFYRAIGFRQDEVLSFGKRLEDDIAS